MSTAILDRKKRMDVDDATIASSERPFSAVVEHVESVMDAVSDAIDLAGDAMFFMRGLVAALSDAEACPSSALATVLRLGVARRVACGGAFDSLRRGVAMNVVDDSEVLRRSVGGPLFRRNEYSSGCSRVK